MTDPTPAKTAPANAQAPEAPPDAPATLTRERLLRAKVLRALKPCGDYWLDADTLLLQLALTEPQLTTRDLADALSALREKAYVDFRVDELTALTEWRLTPTGRELARDL